MIPLNQQRLSKVAICPESHWIERPQKGFQMMHYRLACRVALRQILTQVFPTVLVDASYLLAGTDGAKALHLIISGMVIDLVKHPL